MSKRYAVPFRPPFRPPSRHLSISTKTINFQKRLTDEWTMNKIIMALFLLIQSNITSAQDLNPLLEMRPGDTVKSKLKLNGSNKDFFYEIEKNKDVVKSVSIEFKTPTESSKLIPPNTEGYCRVEIPEGHVVIYRYYFFDMNKKRRYELTPLKKISKILIQDMPGAIENPKCTFESFKMREVK